MFVDNINAKGSLTLTLTDVDGNIKSEQNVKNLVVGVGLSHLVRRAINNAVTVMSHMALGSGTVPAALGDTTLGTETGRTALQSSSNVTTNVSNDSVQFIASFGAGAATGAITEAGIFNAASAGDMLCRTVFNVVNKDANDTLTVTWKIVLS